MAVKAESTGLGAYSNTLRRVPAESPLECWFLSPAHDEAVIDQVIAAARASLDEV